MSPRKLIRQARPEPKQEPISGKERGDLNRIIKARAKALKIGIDQRKADQLAEVERQINARYAEQRAAFREVEAKARALVAEFNTKIIRPLYDPLVGDHPEWGGFAALITDDPPDLERALMRKRANLEVEAAAKSAFARLAQWEAQALEAVAITGIVSSEAHALLAEMASIETLMPMVAIPATAEAVVTEMAMAEGKMPWLRRDDMYHEVASFRHGLDRHAAGWRRANALPAVASEVESAMERANALPEEDEDDLEEDG
jgi:hypothetical protein